MNATPLAAWTNFYVIVGSSAAALTGLMFVAVALVAERANRGMEGARSSDALHAYGTPTVVHFCGALLVGAILSAPWRGIASVAIAVGSVGVAGVAYVGLVLYRQIKQRSYEPVMEDWIWHSICPFLAYAAMIVTAILLRSDPALAMFFVGAGTLLLLFIGIHNAWDTVVYVGVDLARVQAEGTAVPAEPGAPSLASPTKADVSPIADD